MGGARLLIVVLGVSMGRAEANEAYSLRLPFRADDPFVFCTQGQDRDANPLPCWIPTPPYTGQFLTMPYCTPPNPWGGKSWTDDDYASLGYYLEVCPHGETPGNWKGSGPPDRVPFKH